MEIKEILDQNRRDFTAIYECEHCGEQQRGGGYDDANFHMNVIPKMICKSCGKVAKDEYVPMATRYKEHEII